MKIIENNSPRKKTGKTMNDKSLALVKSQSARRTIRIFFVDDSSVFIGVASRFLSLKPEYKVVGHASSGACAIDQIRELKPDLVIMDLVMPGMSGFEATRILKSTALSPRVLVTSFSDHPEYKSSAEETGAD